MNLEKQIKKLYLLPVFMHFYSRVNHSVYNICRGYLFSYQTVLLILIGALVSNVDNMLMLVLILFRTDSCNSRQF